MAAVLVGQRPQAHQVSGFRQVCMCMCSILFLIGRGAGGGRGVRVLPGIIPMALTSDLIRISLVLRKIERTDGSLLSFLFIDLPDAKFYPDYYQIVKYPMSLKLMTKKLRDAQYRTVSEITYDMDMMVANASLYNGPGSPVALDAEHITSEWKRLIGGLEIPDNMLVPVDTSTLPTLASMQAAASERAVDEGAVGEESDNNGEEGCDGEDFEEDPVEINNDESALEDRMGLDESNAMPMDMSEDLGDAVDAPPPVKRLKLSLSGSRPAAPEQPLGNTEEALY